MCGKFFGSVIKLVILICMAIGFCSPVFAVGDTAYQQQQLKKACELIQKWQDESKLCAMPAKNQQDFKAVQSHGILAQQYFQQAETILTRDCETSGDSNITGPARYWLSYMYEKQQYAQKCIDYARQLIDTDLQIPGISKERMKCILYLRLGDAYWIIENYESAAEAYFNAVMAAKNPNDMLDAWLRLLQFSPRLASEKFRTTKLPAEFLKQLEQSREKSEIQVTIGPAEVIDDTRFKLPYAVTNKSKHELKAARLTIFRNAKSMVLFADIGLPKFPKELGRTSTFDVKAGEVFHGTIELSFDEASSLLGDSWAFVGKLDMQGAIPLYWTSPALIDIDYNPEVFKNSQLCPDGSYEPILYKKINCRHEDVTLSPDGKKVCYIPMRGQITLMDVDTGKVLRTCDYKFYLTRFSSPVFSPAGQVIALGGDEEQIFIFDARSLKLLKTIKVEADAFVSCEAVSSDCKFLASEHCGIVKVVDVFSGITTDVFGKNVLPIETLYNGEKYRPLVHKLAFSPDGKLLAGVNDKGLCQIWDLESGCVRYKINNIYNVDDMFFASNNQLICTPRQELWTINLGNDVKIEKKKIPQIFADGNRDFRLMPELQYLTISRMSDFHQNSVVSKDVKFAATLADKGWIGIWDIKSGKILRVMRPMGTGSCDIQISNDGKKLLAAYEDGFAVWRIIVK